MHRSNSWNATLPNCSATSSPKNAYPDAIRRVRMHRAAGHRTVLITGALDFIVKNLEPLFDDIICPSLEQHDGRYTGRMLNAPPIGEMRAEALRQYATEHNIDLQESVAYADSTATCQCSKRCRSRLR